MGVVGWSELVILLPSVSGQIPTDTHTEVQCMGVGYEYPRRQEQEKRF